MAPLDRSYTSSCWPTIVTMVLSCIISEIKARSSSKIAIIHTRCIRRPVRGARRNIAVTFRVGKLEWCGYLSWNNTLSSFGTHRRVTDRHLVTAQSALCIASRGKNAGQISAQRCQSTCPECCTTSRNGCKNIHIHNAQDGAETSNLFREWLDRNWLSYLFDKKLLAINFADRWLHVRSWNLPQSSYTWLLDILSSTVAV